MNVSRAARPPELLHFYYNLDNGSVTRVSYCSHIALMEDFALAHGRLVHDGKDLSDDGVRRNGGHKAFA
jgi:hypothetical protein